VTLRAAPMSSVPSRKRETKQGLFMACTVRLLKMIFNININKVTKWSWRSAKCQGSLAAAGAGADSASTHALFGSHAHNRFAARISIAHLAQQEGAVLTPGREEQALLA